MLTNTELLEARIAVLDEHVAELRQQITGLGNANSALVDSIREMGQAVAEYGSTATMANGTALKAHDRIDQLDGEFRAIRAIQGTQTEMVARLWTGRQELAAIGEQQPAVRIRVSHAFTQKSGWVCDGTTVEWCGPVGGIDPEGLLALSTDAFNAGVREANLRNAPQPDADEEA